MSVAPPLRRPTRRVPTGQPPREPLALTGNRRGALGNRIFAGVSTGAAIVILIVLAAVAGFLLLRAWPALTVPVDEVAVATGGKSFWAYVRSERERGDVGPDILPTGGDRGLTDAQRARAAHA